MGYPHEKVSPSCFLSLTSVWRPGPRGPQGRTWTVLTQFRHPMLRFGWVVYPRRIGAPTSRLPYAVYRQRPPARPCHRWSSNDLRQVLFVPRQIRRDALPSGTRTG